MKHDENIHNTNQQPKMTDEALAHTQPQVPSSLLPTVLHRLGLTPAQTQQEMSVETVLANLKSDRWEERAAAVRLLGKLGTVAPITLLETALGDEDGSVRAAALHAMGNVGKNVPLHHLVQALQDSDWHVRETAVFVMGEQGQRVPDDVIKLALYDKDNSVREAARLALQTHTAHNSPSTMYGQLQEKKMMQSENDSLHTSKENHTSYNIMPYETLNENTIHNQHERFHGLREQTQAYAPQEYAPQEQEFASMSGGEKVTSYASRRGSSKKWWFIVPLVAAIFFIFGMLFSVAAMRTVMPFSKSQSIAAPKIDNTFLLPTQLTKYSHALTAEVSSALHLAPKQVVAQLQMGKSLTDIAATQGISAAQFQDIETKALNSTLQDAVNAGDFSQPDLDRFMLQTQNNPKQMDAVIAAAFELNSSSMNN